MSVQQNVKLHFTMLVPVAGGCCGVSLQAAKTDQWHAGSCYLLERDHDCLLLWLQGVFVMQELHQGCNLGL